jgi:hypothetical protein
VTPRRVLPALAAALLFSPGCAHPKRTFGVPEPISRPPIAARSPDEVFGFQADVSTPEDRFFGELVACDESFLFLYLNETSGNPWQAVPWSAVSHAEVETPGRGRAALITWTVVGSLSSASHGLWASMSYPVWTAVGIPSLLGAVRAERVSGRCADLVAYTRYPQGIPPSMRAHYFPASPLADLPLPVAPLPAPSGASER